VNRGWRAQSERGSPILVRLMLRIALGLGRTPARLLLYPITLYFLLTGRRARHASRRLLGRVYGREARRTEVFAHIHTFAAVILDRVFFLSGRTQGLDVRFHGLERLESDLASGRGCLMLGAHMGSFDALRALALQRGEVRLKVLMEPEHNAFISGLLESLDPGVADTVIPLGGVDTLVRVQAALASGSPVGLLADRVAGSRKVVMCTLLGGSAPFPTGPMLMAAALKVPVILFCALYRGGNRYDVHFEHLGDTAGLGRENRREAAARWTCRYVERLEHYIRLAPYNWFNFYDFWGDEQHRA
jgi:predicted LPLAT superfamily acyltransferase